MQEIYNIPILYKQGVYDVSELKAEGEVLELNYSEYGDIVTYELPDSEHDDEIRLYGISKEILDDTLNAAYDENGCLKMLTVNKENKDKLLYIHYESAEETKEEIKKFAQENAKNILDKIGMCKDTVSRLFVEYFNDGEYMDFYAKVGTETEKTTLEKKYPEYANIGDSCGNYSSEILDGDNDRLKVMVSCADNEDFDYFGYATCIMAKFIEKEAPELLNKADDFKYMCSLYD